MFFLKFFNIHISFGYTARTGGILIAICDISILICCYQIIRSICN